MQTDNNGIPSGTVLATREFVWVDAGGSNFPLFSFASPATLTAGTRYHLVFSNIDANPATNYMSINTMYVFPPVFVPRQPGRSDSDYFTALMKQGSTWSVKGGYTPNIDLTYGNGAHQGQGSSTSTPRTDRSSRARTTSSGNGSRSAVATGSCPAPQSASPRPAGPGTSSCDWRTPTGPSSTPSRPPPQRSPSNSAVDGKAGVWVSGTFTSPRTLTNGATYNLRLSTDSSTSLWTRGIQTGRHVRLPPQHILRRRAPGSLHQRRLNLVPSTRTLAGRRPPVLPQLNNPQTAQQRPGGRVTSCPANGASP